VQKLLEELDVADHIVTLDAMLIFNSCGVGMGCKSLIFQGSRAGFLKNVVPRRGVLWLIILTYDEIMC
jgi:hypothetical protein